MPERARKPSESTGDTAASPGRPAPAPAALALQRLAGNRVVTSLVQASRNQHREEEADTAAAVAGATMGEEAANRAAAGLAGPGPRHLPPSMQAALRPVVGDTTDITVDAGSGSARATDAIGARAFADGPSVHLHPAERSATDAGGLVLHEAAHAALHAPAPGLVHAKLRGTRAAVESQGGATSSGAARKLLSRFSSKLLTKWDLMLNHLSAYEAAEVALESGGPVSPQAFAQVRLRLLGLLSSIDAAAEAWTRANGGAAANAPKPKKKTQFNPEAEEDEEVDIDGRTKSSKRQAVAMLLTRVTAERVDIRSGAWLAHMGLNDTKRTGGQDKAGAGQVNTVDRVIYDIGGGQSFEGFFKADKGFEDKAPGHQEQVGINNTDPNYAGRAIAMYRLDQLLGTDVIARSEFAVHNNTMGSVTEKAKGTAASRIDMALTDAERDRRGGDTISAEDPVLQRCLNKLQIIDAIAGQLDRHAGNYYIQTDGAGKVTGVTGIDLDMAFGKEQGDASIGAKPGSAVHYRGVPALVDKALGARLIQLTEQDVERAIAGLLSPEEVAATKRRFTQVRDHALALQRSGQLVSQWDASTAKSERPEKATGWISEFSDLTSYLATLVDSAGGSDNLQKPVNQAVSAVCLKWREAQVDEHPEFVKAVFDSVLSLVGSKVVADAYGGGVGVDQAPALAVAVTAGLLRDSVLVNRLHIAVQEGGGVKGIVGDAVDQLIVSIKAQGIPALIGG
jgi:hypothetical protein